MRTSQQQYNLMLTFMEEHGDLSKPSTDTRGRVVALRRWDELTSRLNCDGSGDIKTTEKWKKVWSDFKNNAKKKAARLHRAASAPGGGPAAYSKLTYLEHRALNIIGIQAATGLAIDEAGLSQKVYTGPSVAGLRPKQAPASISVLDGTQELEGSSEPEPNHATAECLKLADSPHSPPPPTHVDNDIIEDAEYVDQPTPAPLSPHLHVVASAPRVLPALTGQTRRAGRIRRTRGLPRRLMRPSDTEQAAQHFLQSDAEWREFKMQQHRDTMEIRREENRIREMEVQTWREWQALGLRALDLIEKVVTKYCK